MELVIKKASHLWLSTRKMLSPAQAGLFVLLIVGFCWTGQSLTHQKNSLPRELVAPPAGLVHFHFGFRNAIADTLWVRSIQDFDFCEKSLAKHLCVGNGWLFQVLDLLTNLDPKFRMAYSAGGLALTIIVSDYSGASRIFDKGVSEFPNDWQILYKAGYHALIEEKDKEKAAALFKRAAANGAPDWLYILAGRLYTDAGQRELAERVLAEIHELGLGERFEERLRQKIEAGPGVITK